MSFILDKVVFAFRSSVSAIICHQSFVGCNKTSLLYFMITKVLEGTQKCRNFQNSSWYCVCLSLLVMTTWMELTAFCKGWEAVSATVCYLIWKNSFQFRQVFFWFIWTVDWYMKHPWCLLGGNSLYQKLFKRNSTD